MEFVQEIVPEIPLSEIQSVAQKVFLENWNVELYYEAMALDWDYEMVENENDDLN